jgi:hypothetical protein
MWKRDSNYMIQCNHCDVDAYYKLTIEDFNDIEPTCMSLCIKCVKIEMKKIIDSFPALKSLKIEPILSPLIETR